MKTGFITEGASSHLNMIRGLAALAVMVGHARSLFFADYAHVAHPVYFVSALYFATALGHQAVMVFFVLSGFLVGGAAVRSARSWSWRLYLTHRFTRLYLVLIPALVLTAVCDWATLQTPRGASMFLYALPRFNNTPFSLGATPAAFAGNLFFLQTIRVPAFGSNAPLWSLANEFWYYLLFPLLLLAAIPGRFGKRLIYACAFLALAIALPRNMIGLFGVWLLGVLVSVVRPFRLPRRFAGIALAASFLLLGFALVLSRSGRLGGFPADLLVGSCFAGVLLLLVRRQPLEGAWRISSTRLYKKAGALTSGCSYSIYATHLPLLILLRSAIPAPDWPPEGRYLIYSGLIVTLVACAGFLFSRLTESHTGALRDLLNRIAPSSQPELASTAKA